MEDVLRKVRRRVAKEEVERKKKEERERIRNIRRDFDAFMLKSQKWKRPKFYVPEKELEGVRAIEMFNHSPIQLTDSLHRHIRCFSQIYRSRTRCSRRSSTLVAQRFDAAVKKGYKNKNLDLL